MKLKTYEVKSSVNSSKCLRTYSNQSTISLSIIQPAKWTDITLSPEDTAALIEVLTDRLAEIKSE